MCPKNRPRSSFSSVKEEKLSSVTFLSDIENPKRFFDFLATTFCYLTEIVSLIYIDFVGKIDFCCNYRFI